MLTPRQYDVVTAILTGETYAEIGERLGMTEQTVKNHVASARQRVGARSTVELYVRIGWLVPPGHHAETVTAS